MIMTARHTTLSLIAVSALALAPGCSSTTPQQVAAPTVETATAAPAATATPPATEAPAAAPAPATAAATPPAAAPTKASPKVKPKARPGKQGKLQAPVTAKLQVSGTTGVIDATLTFTPSLDIRKTVTRFRLPAGAQLISGNLETAVGDLKAGTKHSVAIKLRAPATGSHVLSATVRVEAPTGRVLNKAAATRIGPDPRPETTRVKTFPDGTGVRLAK
jgi:hypothetical protein